MITSAEYEYSAKHFNKPLCHHHQKTTPLTIKLYDKLQEYGIKCELEYWDGHIHTDISIPVANLYIEIDGKQHITDPRQLCSDLMRNFESAQRGIFTIRIPNHILNRYFSEVFDSIKQIINILSGKDILTQLDDDLWDEFEKSTKEKNRNEKKDKKSNKYPKTGMKWMGLDTASLIEYHKKKFQLA